MSTDAWRVCPQCKKNHDAEVEKLQNRTDAAYGKIPPEQYRLMLDAVEQIENKKLDETLREDYEIYTDKDGKFYMKYEGSCSVCGFHHTEKIERQILK